jgi:hypothetical protein
MVESSSRLPHATMGTVNEASVQAEGEINAQGRLESWTTEILCKRLFETVIVVFEEIGKLEDLGPAGLDGLELAGSEVLAQFGMDLGVG